MKIWITRDTAGSIMGGGLERLWVWFTKPTYACELMTDKDRDTPFGFIHESHGLYRRMGWQDGHKFGVRSLSFGSWLGYGDEENENKEIANLVWNKLKEHFHNEPFGQMWVELERQNVVKQQDFLLELDVKLQLQVPVEVKTKEIKTD